MIEARPELRVEIRKLGNRYQAVTRAGDGQEVIVHEFQYDTASLVRGAAALLPEPAAAETGTDSSPDPTQVTAQGWQLYHDLFDNGRRLRDYLASHQGARRGQITLSFAQDAALLSRLPWEYLYDGSAYLCLSGNMPVSYRPQDLCPLRREATAQPVRVLLVIAAPEDQAPFDVEQEIAILQEALNEVIGTGALALDVLSEPTSTMLLEAAQTHAYHVVHYVGHGIYQLSQREGFLCLEDSVGRSELISGGQLPRFAESSLPYLVVLAGCPCAQYGVADGFAGVAQDLLRQEIPSVLSIPAHLDARAARGFYKAFYGSLSRGETMSESLHRGRLALKTIEDRKPDREHQFDWAIPVLYQRDPHLRLIAPHKSAPHSATDETPVRGTNGRAALPVIGRKSELLAVRRALREGARVFYLWGSDGVGKRSFVTHLVNHLSPRPFATLVIQCSDGTEPLAVLARIADFWRAGGSEADEEAAQTLLDGKQPPFERARKAQKLLENRRLLFCFENIDRWFAAGIPSENRIANATVRSVLLGLISVPSKSLFFFTGARQWDELRSSDNNELREIYLPLLSRDWAVQVMNRLPGLQPATLAQKHAVHWHIGGHPKSLELLAGWLYMGEDLASLLAAPPVEERSTGLWEDFLIDRILDNLDPGEFQVLRTLTLIPHPFSTENLSELTPVTAQYAQPLIEKWRRLGLIELINPGVRDPVARFDLYPPVSDAMMHRISPGECAELHQQAAARYAAPFVDAARRQVMSRNIAAWTRDRIEWLARDTNGILGTWLRQHNDGAHPQDVLARAMAWQQHLLGAGKIDEATQVVQAIAPELRRQGQIDLAEALLQRTLTLSAQPGLAASVDQIAQLRLEEGPLSAALEVYRQVYESLDAQQAGLQRAHVLMRAAMVQQRLGSAQRAIQDFEAALQAVRHEGDKESEAECLYRLAMLHRQTGQVRQALVYSQAAREHYEAFDSPSGLATVEREQGLILKELGHLENALESFAASLRICRKLGDPQCLTENLTEIGLILEKLGRNEMAIRVIEEALQHYEYLKSPEHSDILALLEDLYARKQRLDEAVAKLRTARNASRSEAPPS